MAYVVVVQKFTFAISSDEFVSIFWFGRPNIGSCLWSPY